MAFGTPTPPHQAASSGFTAGKGKEDGPTANALGSFAGHVTVPEKHRTPERPQAKPNPSYVRGSRGGPLGRQAGHTPGSTELLALSGWLQNTVSDFMESSKGHRGT